MYDLLTVRVVKICYKYNTKVNYILPNHCVCNITGQPLSEEATYTFLVKAIQALQIHGQHDNCLYTLLNVIVSIIQLTHRTIPHVTRGVLSQIPHVIPDKIERFFKNLERREASDRNLRDSLQSVVNPIISRPISEAGKQHYKITELGPLLFQKKDVVVEQHNGPEGLHSLFNYTNIS